jgi:exopolysaccharide biosynthesis protein
MMIYSLILFVCLSCASAQGNGEPFQGPVQKSSALADWSPQWESLVEGVDIGRGKIENPRLTFYFLRVNLNAGFRIVLNEPGEKFGVVSSVFVSSFAKNNGCIAAINASPFDVASSKEGENRRVVGVFVAKGVMRQKPNSLFAAIVFKTDGSAEIMEQSQINDSALEHIENAVGGFRITLKDRKIAERVLGLTARHPRTAVGLSDDGRVLYMLAVDGRRIWSVGATEEETAAILAALGAEQGLNMDGGGSTALALNGRVVNRPVNRTFSFPSQNNERAVGVCIGVTRL